jgi:hypothetical protein
MEKNIHAPPARMNGRPIPNIPTVRRSSRYDITRSDLYSSVIVLRCSLIAMINSFDKERQDRQLVNLRHYVIASARCEAIPS